MSRLSQPIRGIVPPLVTPLRSQDELDAEGLQRLIEYQVTSGVAGLFILGTTGEGPSLSYRLRYELVERTCEMVGGRVPVLVGVTDTSLTEAVELAEFAKAVGASAIVSAAPYYFSVGQDGVRDYLLKLANDAALPMFVYDMPSCVKISLTFETIERLASHSNICGVKDSSGDIGAFQKILELRSERPDWTFLIGPEHLTAQAVLMGGDGGVSGGANLHPKLFVEIYKAAVRRDQKEVDFLQAEVDLLGSLYNLTGTGVTGYLQGLKGALAIAGICSGQLAAPFKVADETYASQIHAIVDRLGLSKSIQSVR